MVVTPDWSKVGLELMIIHQTMSGMIGDLNSQTFILQAMLISHIRLYCIFVEM